MKKVFTIVLLLLLLTSFGQQFEFVSNVGIRNSENNSLDYLAFSFPNMTSGEIKAIIISKLSSSYNSPKDVINSIGDNVITLDACALGLFYRNSYRVDADFTITIHFKDGKVRYDAPIIHQLYYDTFMGKLELNMSIPIYKLIETNLERGSTLYYFNQLVRDLNEAVSKSDDW